MTSPTEAETSDASDREPAVRLSGVVKHWGRRCVLDHADLEVRAGEMVAVGGPSGAGKSTTLHLIASLEVPEEGEICVFGKPVGHHRHESRYRRETVGIIFQLHNLIARLTARQNVEMAMFGTGLRRAERVARAEELLGEVGLGDLLDARPPVMSGGERQRVAIARALANHPRLVLADEPTGNLDDEATEVVRGVLRRLVDEDGVTVLAVSHDARLNEAADRLVRLEHGRFVVPATAAKKRAATAAANRR
jgi:ABC-type lipoprotein export system ATPase subunit